MISDRNGFTKKKLEETLEKATLLVILEPIEIIIPYF